MPIPREDLMRLLIEIDQRITALRDSLSDADWQPGERKKALYQAVCLGAAKLMVEEKLNVGEKPGQPDWETILEFCRLSKNWPDG